MAIQYKRGKFTQTRSLVVNAEFEERIQHLADRESVSWASMVRKLCDEALLARGENTAYERRLKKQANQA